MDFFLYVASLNLFVFSLHKYSGRQALCRASTTATTLHCPTRRARSCPSVPAYCRIRGQGPVVLCRGTRPSMLAAVWSSFARPERSHCPPVLHTTYKLQPIVLPRRASEATSFGAPADWKMRRRGACGDQTDETLPDGGE